MKNFTFLSFLIIPTLIAAQSDDYCPCMESSNPLINVMNMVSSMDDIGAENFVYQKNPSTSNFSQEQTWREDFEKKETTNLPSKAKEQKTAILKAKKSRVKSLKKVRSVRLKARKKVRKYRGKCPSF